MNGDIRILQKFGKVKSEVLFKLSSSMSLACSPCTNSLVFLHITPFKGGVCGLARLLFVSGLDLKVR